MYFSSTNVLLTAALSGLPGWVQPVFAGSSPSDTRLQAIHRAFLSDTPETSLTKRDIVLKNTTSINKSFTGATLFNGTIHLEGPGDPSISIAVVCTTCYVTGQVTAELAITPPPGSGNNFNASANISSVAHAFVGDVANITTAVLDDVEAAIKNATADLKSSPSLAGLRKAFDDLTEPPTIDADFALAAAVALPEYQFRLTLDAFDLFIQTQTSVSGAATYTVNLYTSESEVGLRLGNGVELGIVLTVDLLMSLDAGLQIDSGFHLRLDDGLALNVDLFGNDVADIVFNGGSFEFLPVTVDAEITLNAILRVGVHAGIILSTDELKVDDIALATYSAGVETILFADVANLTMRVAASNNGSAASDLGDGVGDLPNCGGSNDLVVEEVFGFGIGAAAGASVQIGDFLSWGIGPTSMLPVYYTTVAQCVGGASADASVTTTSTAPKASGRDRRAVAAADAETTTVISTTFTHSAVGCRSAGLINCPASLQTTAVTSTASTTTLTVRSGTEATWPAPTATTPLTSTATFGNNAKSIALSASGTPSSFVPPTSTATGLAIGGHHLTTKQEHIIIGVTVGVGVPLVVGLIAATIFLVRRKRGPVGKGSPQQSVQQVNVVVAGKK